MKALETEYYGHHFRSRIEARWAVFFVTLGVRWVYELKHYDFGLKRPWLDDADAFNEYLQEALEENSYDERSDVISRVYHDRHEHEMYLPDFFLPDLKHWVEIKGKSPDFDERSKARKLAERSHMPVTILWGYIPDPDAKRWGECSEVYLGDMNIIALFVLEYGVTAMQKAFLEARRVRFQPEH